MIKKILVGQFSIIILSGCVGLEREITNTPLDLRKDRQTKPAVLIRESAPIFSDNQTSPYAETNKYASTRAEYVILDDYTDLQRKNAIWHDKSPMKHALKKVSNSYDRIYLPAGSHRIRYSCFVSFAIDRENPHKKPVGDIFSKFEAGKCYQLKTSSNIKYLGLEQHDRYGRVNRVLEQNDPNWFKQCDTETTIEEIECSSIQQQF